MVKSVMFFGKKDKDEVKAVCPVLVNVPQTVVVTDRKPDKSREIVEYYAIATDRITTVGERFFYPLESLHRLTPNPHPASGNGPWLFSSFREYTDGKCALWMHDGKPMFEVSLTDSQVTFHPEFFRTLGKNHWALLKIQAPRTWHDARTTTRTRLDPKIEQFWKPEWSA